MDERTVIEKQRLISWEPESRKTGMGGEILFLPEMVVSVSEKGDSVSRTEWGRFLPDFLPFGSRHR